MLKELIIIVPQKIVRPVPKIVPRARNQMCALHAVLLSTNSKVVNVSLSATQRHKYGMQLRHPATHCQSLHAQLSTIPGNMYIQQTHLTLELITQIYVLALALVGVSVKFLLLLNHLLQAQLQITNHFQ